MKIKAIVFDFDGVITDSKSLKRDAWRAVFSDRNSNDNELLQKEVGIGKGNRYEILRRTLLSSIGVPETELDRLVNYYADRYNELVQTGIKTKGLFLGVVQMFGRLSKKYPLYINTATPDIAIQITLEEFGLKNFFHGVFGSLSGSKEENLRQVITELNVKPFDILMVGDEAKDKEAAEKVGTRFIGIADSINKWTPRNFPHPLLKETALLEGFLERNL